MDSSDASWLEEMGLDSCIFMDQQCDFFMDSLEQDVAAAAGLDPELEACFSSGNNSSSSSSSSSNLINISSTNSITSLCSSPHQDSPPILGTNEPPRKLLKPNSFNSFSAVNPMLLPAPDRTPSSTPIILSFGNTGGDGDTPKLNPVEEAAVSEVLSSEGSNEGKLKTGKKTGRVRPPSQTYDHIIAERKRREQLSQRFHALSTIVPGLKKMDKTSVLGDAIKYLKHLQEKVKTLEEQATKQTMESVVLVKKSQVEEEGSSDDNSEDHRLPEIEARVCNNHILVRVQCEKQKGVLVNLLSQVEMLDLVVVNTNVTPFGSFAIDITIVAEMEKESKLTAREVVKTLRAAI